LADELPVKPTHHTGQGSAITQAPVELNHLGRLKLRDPRAYSALFKPTAQVFQYPVSGIEGRWVGKKSAKRVRRAWAASRGSGNEQPSPVMALGDTCSQCHRPLIEIDHFGERLIGCIECNRWGLPGSKHLFMALPEDDLQILSNLSSVRHKAEDTSP
jgi:hypothetical protein